uniref:Ubiquitin-like protease family profile domain-containing protein n=1 Tax=Solanum lycopersicum TaxID=4081 RepID=A0A3Q7JLL1_SOLLC
MDTVLAPEPAVVKKLENKDEPEKKKPVNDGKTRNRLSKSVILPESRYSAAGVEVDKLCLDLEPEVVIVFENKVASEDEVSKFRLPETRDYYAEILKLEPKGSSHGLDILTNEIIELRKELVKSGGSKSFIREVREPSKKQADETFSGGLDFNGDEDVAGIAIEKVLSKVIVDINEEADLNIVGEKSDGNTKITNSFFKLCDAHEDKKFKVKDSDDISRYICGRRLLEVARGIKDCGVFVIAFAEFVNNGQHILNQQVKADILRKRFGAILWEYARRNQASDLQSEDERPVR